MTFNVWDISPFIEYEGTLDLRLNLNQPGEDDAGGLGPMEQLSKLTQVSSVDPTQSLLT